MKEHLYKKLVSQRKKCRKCSGLCNPGEDGLKQFDSGEIGPWSRLHGDLNASIMVVGQDWGDTVYYGKNSGLDNLKNPTMQTLEKLLYSINFEVPLSLYGESNSGLFLTNAILCLKEGGLQGNVEKSWFENCGKHFLRPQIEIISPKIVVALGQKSYESILRSFSIPVRKFRESVELERGTKLPNGSHLFAVYHCGNRILNTHRNFEEQLVDWLRIKKILSEE